MKTLIFSLLLFSSFSAKAKSIFGQVFILPIEVQNVGHRVRIQEELIDFVKEREFEHLYRRDVSKTLLDLYYDIPKDKYEEALGKVIKRVDSDLFFRVQIQSLSDGQRQLVFRVINNDGKTIFQRESAFTYSRATEYIKRVKTWIEEFQDILPAVGEIIEIEKGKIKIKIVHQSSSQNFSGRSFSLGSFQYNALGSDSYKRMGAIIEKKSDNYFGYIYEEFQEERVDVGDHLIFLDDVINENLNYKEKLFVSETWFNYINSPKFSLLDCTLLPILGNTEHKDKVFKTVSEKIQEDKICKYRDDKKLYNILSRYKSRLNQHLKNERVLKNLSQVLRVGALFRIGVYKILNGVSVAFDVVSENGKNIYFSKYTVIEEADDEYIAELVLAWIREYKKSLPLSGKVVQVIDNRVIIDIPAGLVDGVDQDFQVVRPISLKYEDVKGKRKISWKKKTLAYGVVKSIHEHHSVGQIWKFEDKQASIKEGDWIIIKTSKKAEDDLLIFKKHNLKNQRNIGVLRVHGEFAQVTAENESTESITSIGAGVDFYLPYGAVLIGEASRNLTASDDSISNNNFSVALGYSFTPRLLSYFSFVDVYVGKRIVNYNVEGLNQTGVGDLKYDGFFIGAKADVKVYKSFNIQFGGHIAPSDDTENTDSQKLFGKAVSSRSYGLSFIGKYNLKKSHNIYVEYHRNDYSTDYDNGVEDINLKITSNLIRLGYSLDF